MDNQRGSVVTDGSPWWTSWDWFDCAMFVALSLCLAYATQPWETFRGDCSYGFGCPAGLYATRGPVVLVGFLLALVLLPYQITRRAIVFAVTFSFAADPTGFEPLALFATRVATYPARAHFFAAANLAALISGAGLLTAVVRAMRRRAARRAQTRPPPING